MKVDSNCVYFNIAQLFSKDEKYKLEFANEWQILVAIKISPNGTQRRYQADAIEESTLLTIGFSFLPICEGENDGCFPLTLRRPEELTQLRKISARSPHTNLSYDIVYKKIKVVNYFDFNYFFKHFFTSSDD